MGLFHFGIVRAAECMLMVDSRDCVNGIQFTFCLVDARQMLVAAQNLWYLSSFIQNPTIGA